MLTKIHNSQFCKIFLVNKIWATKLTDVQKPSVYGTVLLVYFDINQPKNKLNKAMEIIEITQPRKFNNVIGFCVSAFLLNQKYQP